MRIHINPSPTPPRRPGSSRRSQVGDRTPLPEAIQSPPQSDFKIHQFSIHSSTHFGTMLVPKLAPESTPKSIQNLIYFLIDFWMRFWSQNEPQNGTQNHKKSFTNQSRTACGLKNVIFLKLAPRLHESSIFEGPGSSKHSHNLPKTVQEPLQNPTEILIEFWIDFLLILAPFWLPKLVQNWSKNDQKNVLKNQQKNHWKMDPKLSLKWRYFYEGWPPFWGLFRD